MTIDEFIEKKAGEPSRGTDFGHHFIQAFNQNKWHFYLKHVLGFEAVHTAPALLFGGTLHDCVEAWRVCEDGQSGQSLKKVFNAMMKLKREQYASLEVWREDGERGLPMLMEFVNKWAADDRDNYELVECEVEHAVKMANGFPITVKFDALFRDKRTRSLLIDELKSTGYSIPAMYKSVEEQDQATQYEWAASKLWPNETMLGIRPTIIYKKGNVVKCERPGYISRGPYALRRHELAVIGLYMDLANRLRALERKIPPELLFPRNGKDTAYFSDEFGCLDWIQPDSRYVPEGFVCKRDEAREKLARFLNMWDECEKLEDLDWTEAVNGPHSK